jgi:hypothetical protein
MCASPETPYRFILGNEALQKVQCRFELRAIGSQYRGALVPFCRVTLVQVNASSIGMRGVAFLARNVVTAIHFFSLVWSGNRY